MIIHFEYSARDFEEAAVAQEAFFAKKSPEAMGPWGFFTRQLLGWILFVILTTILLFLVNHRRVATATQNVLLTLIPVMVVSCVILSVCASALSKPASLGRVPLFTPARDPEDWRRTVLRSIAAIAALLAIGGIVAFWYVPAKPNWTPDGMQLLAANFLPWVVWMIAVAVISRVWQKWADARPNRAERSTRLPQQLEITDTGISIANAMLCQEYTWPFIVSYLESENLMLLFTRDIGSLIVPKRAFADEPSLLQFFVVLQSRVRAGHFLPNASAFPVAPIAPTRMSSVDGKS